MSDDLVETGTIDSTPKVDNKMMASFRIDREDWKRFGELGKRERLTVTELITDYVEKCLAADRSWYGVEISTDKDDVSIGHSHIISTGNDDVLKQVEEMIGTHKDEILTMVREEISTLSVSSVPDSNAFPLTQSIESIREAVSELEAYTMGNFREVQTAIRKLEESRIDAVTPTPAPKRGRKPSEAVDLETAIDASWGAFHQALGLESSTSNKSAELGNVAIAKATELGFMGWTFSGKKQRFYRDSP
jgi:hypothetical protein